jgi:hypothetical protein
MNIETITNNKIVKLDSLQAQGLHERLLSGLPDSPWKIILEAFLITGVMDSEQIQQVSNLERMQATRLLDKLENYRQGSPPILVKVEEKIRRPGTRGKSPNIYLLGESGAGLLRDMGHEDAHACGLKTDITIAHALGMVDVHLAALRDGLEIVTDRNLPYDKTNYLRPDHQVGGEKIRLIEVEQAADTTNLRRVIKSLENKQRFFSSPQSNKIDRNVLVLFQIPRGKIFDHTIRTWKTAIELCVEQTKKELGFSLYGILLSEFLDSPDWNVKMLSWIDMKIGISGFSIQKSNQSLISAKDLPRELSYGTQRKDHLVLAALWQDFKLRTNHYFNDFHQPSPSFFRIMHLIYVASFDDSETSHFGAQLPLASIYLLNQYLIMHPKLQERLKKVMSFGRGTIRWNQTTIVHRMQVVVNEFLAYHGYRSDGSLFVYTRSPSWKDVETGTFKINVSIRDKKLLYSEHDSIYVSNEYVYETEEALSWVMSALFHYGDKLGLGRVEFW